MYLRLSPFGNVHRLSLWPNAASSAFSMKRSPGWRPRGTPALFQRAPGNRLRSCMQPLALPHERSAPLCVLPRGFPRGGGDPRQNPHNRMKRSITLRRQPSFWGTAPPRVSPRTPSAPRRTGEERRMCGQGGGRAPSPATTSMAILTTAHCYVGESGEESSPATGVSWRIGGRGRSSGQDVMKLTVRNLIRPNRGELRRKKKLTPETLQKQGGTSSQGGARTPPEHIPARSRCTGGSLPRQG